jgi:hypothetical protein
MSQSPEQLRKFNEKRLREEALAESFAAMQPEDREFFVREQIKRGEYASDATLSVQDILNLADIYGEWEPEYYRYRMALEAIDPAVSAKEMESRDDARIFIESYGHERAKPFLPSRLWLEVYGDGSTKLETRHHVKYILECRGAEHIAAETFTSEFLLQSDERLGRIMIDIFGIKAASFFPPALARKLKGQHVEDALGL